MHSFRNQRDNFVVFRSWSDRINQSFLHRSILKRNSYVHVRVNKHFSNLFDTFVLFRWWYEFIHGVQSKHTGKCWKGVTCPSIIIISSYYYYYCEVFRIRKLRTLLSNSFIHSLTVCTFLWCNNNNILLLFIYSFLVMI